jgi:virginiamycin A acetyltransferase
MTLEYPFRFVWSDAVENVFRQRRVWLSHHNKITGVFKPGEHCQISAPTYVETEATMPPRRFHNGGAFSYARSGFGPDTQVGRYCSISWGCGELGPEHPTDRISTHLFTFRRHWAGAIRTHYKGGPDAVPFDRADLPPIEIGHDVWIGQDVSIRRGVKIGTGAIVASSAVVTRDVPPYAIVGGVPAKLIRYRFDEPTRERLLASQWWRYHVKDFGGLDVTRPLDFVDGLEARAARGEIQPWEPAKINLAEAISEAL